jgi:hypothetical protein
MNLIRTSTTAIWLLLVVATCISWWFGESPNADQYRIVTTVSVLFIAFIKIRFVIMHFMEVRHAPFVLVVLCNAWVILVFLAVSGLYLIQPH